MQNGYQRKSSLTNRLCVIRPKASERGNVNILALVFLCCIGQDGTGTALEEEGAVASLIGPCAHESHSVYIASINLDKSNHDS